ncbi:MAG: NGG1p interacting factor NIF3 [Pseudomonadales bacterium]
MHKLCYYVPASHLEATKAAVFEAGAGRVGRYDHCCFQVLGQGQFRPLPGSSPFAGSVGKLERIDEYRVEMVCADERVEAVVAALRRAHPYEEPAFDVIRLAEV